MSVLLGLPSRNIQYINVHKEGTDNEEFCSIDSRWSSPVIDQLDQYLVAVTRFEVPANRIPMTQELIDCIKIYKYAPAPMFGDDNVETYAAANGGMSSAALEAHFDNIETNTAYQITLSDGTKNPTITDGNGDVSHRIHVPECYTIYSFLQKLNAQINEALLFNTGAKQILPRGAVGLSPHGNVHARNMFCDSNDIVVNTTQPIAYFKIKMDNDFTFSVEMNNLFAEKYYIKMSQALFNMLGFTEGDSGNFREDLTGRRFMASRNATLPNNYQGTIYNFRQSQFPSYNENHRPIVVNAPIQNNNQVQGVNTTNLQGIYHNAPVATFTAPVSAADSINRLKSLVFTSSIATSSEALSGNGYRRTLTDYTVPIQTSFNYNTGTFVGTISENAAAEYTYTNPNPSAGRFLQISDPSPLYELKVEVFAKCWDFQTNSFVIEPIPLPLAGTFSMKLVFISRTELHRRHKPDAMKA